MVTECDMKINVRACTNIAIYGATVHGVQSHHICDGMWVENTHGTLWTNKSCVLTLPL